VSPRRTDFRIILRTLAGREVDFVVIGGLGAVLQGAPVATFDLDVVHSREPGNVDRLVQALEDLEAWYREHPTRRLRPARELLLGPGHHQLMTVAGPLDLLGALEDGRDHPALLADCRKVDIGAGLEVLVLDLRALIAIKEASPREKDRAMLPILRRTLEERERRPADRDGCRE